MGCSGSKEAPKPQIQEAPAPQPAVQQAAPAPQQGSWFVALYNFEQPEEHVLAFKKGDRLFITDQSKTDWWYGEKDGEMGYVPAAYLISDNKMLGPWFHPDCSRKDAERLLLDTKIGTYLIRNRETAQGTNQGYSLSVRSLEPGEAQRDIDIRHYRIHNSVVDGLEKFYISDKLMFNSLQELIDNYIESEDGLCIKLGDPCPLPAPNLGELSPDMSDKWEIPREHIKLQSQLGSGQFGEVWSALWKDKIKVAVKTMKPGSMKPEAFLQEAKIMKKLQHKHLVRLYAVCTKEEPFYIITELVARGCLLKFLREGDGKKFDPKKLIGMGADVASAMLYLEGHNLIHRDLAARNVLVDEHFSCKVCDFGLARCVVEDAYKASKGSKFPIKWTAPEAVHYGHFTIKADVWSFGVLLYEIITKGRNPYPGMSNKDVMKQVETGHRMSQPEGCPDPLYKIMRNCWHAEAAKRPTFEYLFRALSEYQAGAERQYNS